MFRKMIQATSIQVSFPFIKIASFFPRFSIFFSIVLFSALLFAACKSLSKKDQPQSANVNSKIKPDMPISPLPLAGDYNDEWKIIDSLEQEGLFKSALEKTEALSARAKKDNNGGQIIKTLIFRGKYTTMLDEDGFVKAVQIFEAEEKTAFQPEKSVLQSMLGQLYAIYLQNQAWKIKERTPNAGGEGSDILTWSADRIEQHALDLYSASVREESALRAVPINYLNDVTTPGRQDTVGTLLRPTLYDLLVHRALDHFANERSYLTQPAYAFVLDQDAAFSPATAFVKASFESKDSSSGKWLGIKLFQKITSAHLAPPAGENKGALIDLELQRLQFAHNNSAADNKDELYEQALLSLHKQFFDHPSDAEIVWQFANFLRAQEPPASGERNNLRRAVSECEDAIKRHPGTYGAKLCTQLISEIKASSLQIQVEEVVPAGKASLVFMSYKNLSTLRAKVVRIPNNPEWWENIAYEQQLEVLNGLPAVQQRNWAVPNPGDYYDHQTEIKLDPLPVGRYIVLVSDNEAFAPTQGYVTFAGFSVSQIAVVSFQEKNVSRYVLAHRETGAPLSGVKADFYKNEYNYSRNRRERKHLGSATSDGNGMLNRPLGERENGEVWFSLGADSLSGGGYYNYYYRENKPRPAVQFFTDRKIYRPGQTVYFKGVVYDRDDKLRPSIMAGEKVKVKFFDVNNQEKGVLSLKTNEFGTFNGAFTAPASGLTGQMRIIAEELQGSVYFNVEEYKRPKFEVLIKPVEGAYRVNETLTVRGEAKAYAGSNVDGAALRYRVVRRARFPFWDFFWSRKIFPWNTEEMEIANGVGTTGADGGFEIKFTAIPDLKIPKKDQPVFDYTVSVDVTDINGETRSAEQSVSAGYSAMEVDLGLVSDADLDSLTHISLKTTNRSGQPQPASGQITLQRLLEPKQFFKKRYWNKPDQWVISETEFKSDFPDYAWKDEDDPSKWGRMDFLHLFTFNTANANTVDLNGGKVQAGYYELILTTKDAFGEPVEIKRIVHIWDKKNRRTQFDQPAALLEKSTLEPGEIARIWLGGKPADLKFFFAVERNEQLQNPRWVSVNGAEQVSIPIQEDDRGGLSAYCFAVRNNRVYAAAPISLYVPWSNKDLSITYETFRDKLAPGQREEWRLKISGPKKEKVAAEMVAALYDASLDQFAANSWEKIGFPLRYAQIRVNAGLGFGIQNGDTRYNVAIETPDIPWREYRAIQWFDFPMYGGRNLYAAPGVAMMKAQPMMDRESMSMEAPAPAAGGAPKKNGNSDEADSTIGYAENQSLPPGQKPSAPPPPGSLRTNLKETVFFFPELRTDAEGNVIVKFKMNEALTRWKFLVYAHTKDLKEAISVKEVITQKELMVLANPPRFLRAGDRFEFSAKVSNLSQQPIDGKATLNLLDATTLQPMDKQFGLSSNTADFNIQPGQSAPLRWNIRVPADFNGAVTWQVFADGKQFRDGEESTVPVVTNRILVTETMPITVRGGQTKTFTFENLKNTNSKSLVTQRYTLEFTSNPAWYVVQALPYLMEYPHECSEQVFSRYYANTLASSVTEKMPNIRRVYERWKGTDAMKSNLSKNQELKYALLEETPWVLDAQSEEQQRQNIALLFDLNRMADEQTRALNTLAERQAPNGGWPWFPGGREDWYITQYIAEGLGHLQKLGAVNFERDQQAQNMLDKALGFCDAKIEEHYAEIEKLVQQGKTKWEDDHLDGLVIHYLYTRSFFPVDRVTKIHAYYLEQAQRYWLGKGLYQEGLISLALHRNGRNEAALKIVNSLRERATLKEELGMYWPFDWGYYWYQLPIETQSLMVEVFDEVAADAKAVEELRIWLLKNKQTNRWESTKATAQAAYALLLHGENWLANTKTVGVALGGKNLQPNEVEPGTGYFKQQWSGAEVKPSWSDIKVSNPNSNIVWGAAYWQYFEDLDKINTFKKTPLTIVKQLFKEEDSPTGPKLTALANGAALKVGDRLKVRIEIRVDRPMEYVHLKDMRAAGFEPRNVLSSYRWQGGLGYYESTKDLATHFFIDYLPKGTFVFEYPLVVSNRGEMSNGITTIQCMYAPEFTSHSEGIRVRVE